MRKQVDIDEILNEYLGETSEKGVGESKEEELSKEQILELIEKMSDELKVVDLSKTTPKLRVLHPFERDMLSQGAREYLSQLLNTYIIDGVTFELIINRFYGRVEVTCEDIDMALTELKIPREILYN